MRILLLSQYYAPEPEFKFGDLARALVEMGHEVQVITGFPCYPHGKTYAGYRQTLYKEETIDGALVTRVPQLPDHSRSVVRRTLYYLSFALSAATIGLWRSRRADVILVYQSAMPTGLAAWVYSKLKRTPYVLDVADLWPESLAASGMVRNRGVLAVVRSVMRFVYRGAKHINVITEGYHSKLLELGVPTHKISVIHCWLAQGVFDPVHRDQLYEQTEQLADRFNVLYAGMIGPCQDLRVILEAAEMLADLPGVQFILAGDGVEAAELATLARAKGLTNTRFVGRKSPAELQKLYASSEVLLAHLKPNEMASVSIPSKTFAYMASGRPILMAVEGESSELVARHQCGVVVAPSDPEKLADAIRRMVDLPAAERRRMGQAARQAYVENYSSETQIRKVLTTLEDAAASQEAKLSAGVYRKYGKRLVDIVVSLSLLLLLTPVLLLAGAAVRLAMGSPVLFRQRRPGLNGKLFTLHKLRTMRESRDANGNLLGDGDRLTGFGKFLRSTSLDELPELWDVLRGKMSLVGPRPLLEQYLPLYNSEQARRHEVRPGITGLAQVKGRNAISWDERFSYDVQYVDDLSLWLDLKILLQTAACVLLRRGISAEKHATYPMFEGNDSVGKAKKSTRVRAA